jgi:PhzF family phenazine biosynthesis protein
MRLPIFHVDAFASHAFAGNPAAVCPLESWLPDATMQAIAAENNLSETAFFVATGAGYHIRWFTPQTEVDLCGHATLASAFVVMSILDRAATEVRFESRGGVLRVTREADEQWALDFPARPPQPTAASAELALALGATPRETLAARDVLAVFDTEDAVRALRPDMARIAALPTFAVIVTAAGNDVEFVSRFFAPAKGVPEDPVTGSAHCTLIPFWSARLGRKRLRARQVSARGGELFCEDRGERVSIGGRAVLYLEGSIVVP